MANLKSPRRGWWKNRVFGIPDFDEWIMFEIVNAAKNQEKDRVTVSKESPKDIKVITEGEEDII